MAHINNELIEKVTKYCIDKKDENILYQEIEEVSGVKYTSDPKGDSFKAYQKILLDVRRRLRKQYGLNLKADFSNGGRPEKERFYRVVPYIKTETMDSTEKTQEESVNVKQLLSDKDKQIKALQADNERLYIELCDVKKELEMIKSNSMVYSEAIFQEKAESIKKEYEEKYIQYKNTLKSVVEVLTTS